MTKTFTKLQLLNFKFATNLFYGEKFEFLKKIKNRVLPFKLRVLFPFLKKGYFLR